MIKNFNQFLKESASTTKALKELGVEYLYRNTDHRWLLDFLTKGEATPYMDKDDKRFISFSADEDSGHTNDYGSTKIVFDKGMMIEQGSIEVEYSVEFMEENPDICCYVTGFKNEDEYYKNAGYEDVDDYNENSQDNYEVLSWETIVEDSYSLEEEWVMKKITYVEGLIVEVDLEQADKKLQNLLEEKGIKYTIN